MSLEMINGSDAVKKSVERVRTFIHDPDEHLLIVMKSFSIPIRDIMERLFRDERLSIYRHTLTIIDSPKYIDEKISKYQSAFHVWEKCYSNNLMFPEMIDFFTRIKSGRMYPGVKFLIFTDYEEFYDTPVPDFFPIVWIQQDFPGTNYSQERTAVEHRKGTCRWFEYLLSQRGSWLTKHKGIYEVFQNLFSQADESSVTDFSLKRQQALQELRSCGFYPELLAWIVESMSKEMNNPLLSSQFITVLISMCTGYVPANILEYETSDPELWCNEQIAQQQINSLDVVKHILNKGDLNELISLSEEGLSIEKKLHRIYLMYMKDHEYAKIIRNDSKQKDIVMYALIQNLGSFIFDDRNDVADKISDIEDTVLGR